MRQADLILVMSVHPGFSGQGFIPESVAKVADIRKKLDALAHLHGSKWMAGSLSKSCPK